MAGRAVAAPGLSPASHLSRSRPVYRAQSRTPLERGTSTSNIFPYAPKTTGRNMKVFYTEIKLNLFTIVSMMESCPLVLGRLAMDANLSADCARNLGNFLLGAIIS